MPVAFTRSREDSVVYRRYSRAGLSPIFAAESWPAGAPHSPSRSHCHARRLASQLGVQSRALKSADTFAIRCLLRSFLLSSYLVRLNISRLGRSLMEHHVGSVHLDDLLCLKRRQTKSLRHRNVHLGPIFRTID